MATHLKKKQETTAADETVVQHPTHTINQTGLDCLLSLDRVAALAGLRKLAGSLQFSMFNVAEWSIREREKQERVTELGMAIGDTHTRKISGPDPRGNTDLDQRNAMDETARTDAEEREFHPMGFETSETPQEKLNKLACVYDEVLHQIGLRHPGEYDLPQTLANTLDWSIANTGSSVPANEAVLTKLHAAGITDDELATAGREAREKRQARTLARRDEILNIVQSAGNTNDPDAFEKLPLHTQLRLMFGVWKGIATRRKQLVLFIASSGKTDDLSDVALLNNGQKAVEAWCLGFQRKNAELLEALEDAGVNVGNIEATIAEFKAAPKR